MINERDSKSRAAGIRTRRYFPRAVRQLAGNHQRLVTSKNLTRRSGLASHLRATADPDSSRLSPIGPLQDANVMSQQVTVRLASSGWSGPVRGRTLGCAERSQLADNWPSRSCLSSTNQFPRDRLERSKDRSLVKVLDLRRKVINQ